MSNATYNQLWGEGLAELTEQVHLENSLLGLPEGGRAAAAGGGGEHHPGVPALDVPVHQVHADL